jgi:predicted double-glycine peptidase
MAGYNWIGLIYGVLAVFLFALVHRAGRPLARARLVVWGSVALVLSLPGLVLAAHYLRVVPEWPWFYEMRSWRGSELWVLPLGALGGCIAAGLPRRALLWPLLATTGAAIGPFLKPVLAPLPETQFREVWTKEVCIQSTFATCGPASLATLLRAQGVDASERDIARAAHSYRGGTEAWYLAREARARGLDARFRKEAGFPEQVRWPAIIGVKVEEGRGHFIPFLGRDGDHFLVGDPLIGPERLAREELERRYRFTGFALELSRLEDGASR